jgi:hypothetical protein
MGFGTHIVAAVEQLMHAPPSLLQFALPSVTKELCIMWARTSQRGIHHLRLLEYQYVDYLSPFEDVGSGSVVQRTVQQRLHSLVD